MCLGFFVSFCQRHLPFYNFTEKAALNEMANCFFFFF